MRIVNLALMMVNLLLDHGKPFSYAQFLSENFLASDELFFLRTHKGTTRYLSHPPRQLVYEIQLLVCQRP